MSKPPIFLQWKRIFHMNSWKKKTPQTSIHHRYFHRSIRSSLKVIGMCWVFFPFQILWGTSSCAINEPWSSPKKDTIASIVSPACQLHTMTGPVFLKLMQSCRTVQTIFCHWGRKDQEIFREFFEAHLGDEFAQCLIHHGRGAVLDPGHLCVCGFSQVSSQFFEHVVLPQHEIQFLTLICLWFYM